MVRILWLVVALALSALEVAAQTAFALGGQEVNPPDNIGKLCRGKRNAIRQLGEPIAGTYYLVAQLAHIPTLEERAKITAGGIQLKDYLGGNAYFVTVPSDRKWKKMLRGTIIRSLFPLPATAKCTRSITTGDVPDYARKGGRIGVVVAYFAGFSDEWVRTRLQELGGGADAHIMGEPFWAFEVWVSADTALRLAEEAWVKRVGLVSPPNVLYQTMDVLPPKRVPALQ